MPDAMYAELPTLPHPEHHMTWTTSELLAIHKYARAFADATHATRVQAVLSNTADKYKVLREAAQKASPGPWREDPFHPLILDGRSGSSNTLVCTVAVNTFRDEGRNNAIFIVAANPNVVLGLLAELDRLRAFADATHALRTAHVAETLKQEREYVEGGRESVEDALAIVESFGVGTEGLNDEFARQVILAAEVRRLRVAQGGALSPADAEQLEKAITDFEDCGETDVPDAALQRFAVMGYLECAHYNVLPAARAAIDAAREAQATETRLSGEARGKP